MTDKVPRLREGYTEEDWKQFVHDIVWNTPAGEGVEMFDDWNKLAPNFLDNVVPVGEDGDIYDCSDDESEDDGKS